MLEIPIFPTSPVVAAEIWNSTYEPSVVSTSPFDAVIASSVSLKVFNLKFVTFSTLPVGAVRISRGKLKSQPTRVVSRAPLKK